MSIFSARFTRPGPGVSKDEPESPAIVRFFQILGRKFSKFIQLNLLFLIPAVITAALCIGLLLLPGVPRLALSLNLSGGEPFILNLYEMYLVPLPLVLLYPFTAGLTYVTRNFVREEHAFIFSDSVEQIKKNFKQFFLNGLLLYAFYVVFSFAALYYSHTLSSWYSCIPLGLCLLMFVVMIFAQYYMPVMLVTFELTLKQAYKNAFIFALVGLGRNFLITIVFLILAFLFYMSDIMGLTALLTIFFVLLLFFSFCSYVVNFAVYPVIERYLIEPYYNQGKKKAAPAEASTPAELEDNEFLRDELDEEYEEKKPEFVYINGKLVKREVAEAEQLFMDAGRERENKK